MSELINIFKKNASSNRKEKNNFSNKSMSEEVRMKQHLPESEMTLILLSQ